MNKTFIVNLQTLALFLLISLLAITISPDTSFAAEWVGIEKEQSDILFYPPGRHSRIIYRAKESNNGKYFHGIWRNNTGIYPRGETVFYDLVGRFYRTEADLEELTRSWNFFKGKSITFDEPQSIYNGFGKTIYQEFNLEAQSCVAFLRYYGLAAFDNAGTSPGTKQLRGYYCFDTKGQLSETQIQTLLNAVSVRGEKVPLKP